MSDALLLALMQRERQSCAIEWEYVLAYLRASKWPIERRMAELWTIAHDTISDSSAA